MHDTYVKLIPMCHLYLHMKKKMASYITVLLLRVLFHLIQTISCKCFDHLLVEQSLA